MDLFVTVYMHYVYVLCEERFGGCWWSFSWLGQSIPVAWHWALFLVFPVSHLLQISITAADDMSLSFSNSK